MNVSAVCDDRNMQLHRMEGAFVSPISRPDRKLED